MKTDADIFPLRLRIAEPDDLDRLFVWENDPEQWHQSLTPPLTSRHRLWYYLENSTGDPAADGGVRLIIEIPGSHRAGTVDLSDCNMRNGTAFVSIYVASEYRGHHYALSAIRSLATLAREGYGLRRLAALVAADNDASRHLFTKSGFTLTGKFPGWIRSRSGCTDLLIYTKELDAD